MQSVWQRFPSGTPTNNMEMYPFSSYIASQELFVMMHLMRLNRFKQNNNFMMIRSVSVTVIWSDSRLFFPPFRLANWWAS